MREERRAVRCRRELCVILTYMQYNAMGKGAGVELARALEHNSSLTALGLRVCEGEKEGVYEGEEGESRRFVV